MSNNVNINGATDRTSSHKIYKDNRESLNKRLLPESYFMFICALGMLLLTDLLISVLHSSGEDCHSLIHSMLYYVQNTMYKTVNYNAWNWTKRLKHVYTVSPQKLDRQLTADKFFIYNNHYVD